MRNYDDPVILRNITPVSGRILWARHLAQRIEEPMEIFKKHPSVFQGAAGRRVIHMYNRVSQVLLEYEILYHSAWLKTIAVVDEGLTDLLFRPDVTQCYNSSVFELFLNVYHLLGMHFVKCLF